VVCVIAGGKNAARFYRKENVMQRRRGMSVGSTIAITLTAVIITFLITVFLTVGIMSPFGFFEHEKMWHFWQTSNRIRMLHYDEVTSQQLFDGAMRGMTESVGDIYTRFINRDDADEFRELLEGGFYGIGIHIAMDENENVMVLAPIPGTPAYRAGLSSGDVILQVNGEEITDTLQARNLMRGPEGTDVTVTVRKSETGETTDLTITRERIDVPTVQSRIIGENIGYFEISQFSATTANEFADALRELGGDSLDGIIIDLRYNGGGILDSAVEIAGNFLPRGTLVVYSQGRNAQSRREYRTRNSSPIEDVPIVLIANNYSASASELLVGGLRDNERAILVGETTFGKGLIQMTTPVGGGMLNITNAQFFTPNGTVIEGIGITPDVYVEFPSDWQPPRNVNMPYEWDPQINAAMLEIFEMIAR